MSFIITIDGPTSVGKTTIASVLSKKLGFTNIQTGAMYRCVGYEMLRRKIKLTEEEKISELLKEIQIDFKNQEDGRQIVLLNGENVTLDIRSENVTNYTSDVASIPQVRRTLVDFQRRIAQNKNIVIEGRDTGTVVFPDADIKFFLNANPTVRARRKYKELVRNGYEADLIKIMSDMYKWDYDAINRKDGALKKTSNSISIDTTNLSIEELQSIMLEKINKKIIEKENRNKGEYERE